jgi:hypothetical protein
MEMSVLIVVLEGEGDGEVAILGGYLVVRSE